MILVLRLQICGLMVGCCNSGFLGRVQVLINWFWDIVWHRRQFSPMSIMVGKHGSGTKEDPPFWIPTSPPLSHCWSCINFGIASAVREEERLERTKMVFFFFSSFFVNADHVLLWGWSIWENLVCHTIPYISMTRRTTKSLSQLLVVLNPCISVKLNKRLIYFVMLVGISPVIIHAC